MAVVFTFDKGRSSDLKLNRKLRCVAAYALATGIRVRVRWIRSDRNSSEFGSRSFASNVKSLPIACRHLRFPNFPAALLHPSQHAECRQAEAGADSARSGPCQAWPRNRVESTDGTALSPDQSKRASSSCDNECHRALGVGRVLQPR